MVIISDRVGQLSNRLFHFSYFIANSIEYNYKVSYPCFDEYQQFFESTSTNSFLGFPVSTKITPFRLVDRAILKYLNNHQFPLPGFYFLDIRNSTDIYDLKSTTYQNLVRHKTVFTRGWLFKDEQNILKHRDKLRVIFKPKETYWEKVKETISKLRADFDCLVGIHIRRGDYSSWQNGKYCYNDEVYINKMKAIEMQVNAGGKTCCFLVCSNEDINKDSFSELNTCIEKRHFITDTYSLSECDYILGPPSTFSYWASFYGDTPLLLLESPEDDVSLNRFLHY